ncbi:MAG: hypothetical protein EBS19_08265 [Spirochaetia bacterium]|nr:hypothetical protein [Spirochaetia bacterium]
MAKKTQNWFQNMLNSIHNRVSSLNQSKIFAGIMIIIINIASKFVNFKVSKTLESYLKFNFSRDILVFAITWMGTRDIYIALGMTLFFVLMADFLLNENSSMCILPQSYTSKQVAKLDDSSKAPSQEDVIKAKIVLEKAGVKQNNDLADAQMNPEVYKESFTVN